MVVISDTSPVANLIVIEQLEILKLVFDEIVIPPAVDSEIEALSSFSISLETYHQSDWITRRVPSDRAKVVELQAEIDVGESEAIVLAMELKADFLLIDERIGTQTARKLGLETIGLLGVLVKAKEKGVIDRVEPMINVLVERAGFWVGEKLIERVLREVGER